MSIVSGHITYICGNCNHEQTIKFDQNNLKKPKVKKHRRSRKDNKQERVVEHNVEHNNVEHDVGHDVGHDVEQNIDENKVANLTPDFPVVVELQHSGYWITENNIHI